MNPPHAYIHVPFCANKCPYCDFNSHAGRDGERAAYVDALLLEAERHGAGIDPETVYIGGGTPTHLGADDLERLVDGVLSRLGRGRLEEVTVEANPGTLDRAKIRVLRGLGVNRMSLGVQSFDDRHLQTLGRIHDARDAVRSAVLIREGGIPRLSLDLILASPGQTLAEQMRDVERAIDLEPEHVSAYVLTIEEGTAFERLVRSGRMASPEDERDLAHLHLVVERLEAAGLLRYEVSNFAVPGAESRHNLAYWTTATWLGLGAGAHSHEPGRRWKNVDDPAAYIASMASVGHARAWIETAPPSVQAFEALMMGLRLSRGIDLDVIRQRTNIDLYETHHVAIDRYVEQGLLAWEAPMLRPTMRGFDVLSRMLQELLPEEETTLEVLVGER